MTVRRASFFGLVGLVFSAWVVAMGCSLETSGYGETDDVCTTPAHCDDNNVCTNDVCGADGVCDHTAAADGQFPDGVNGNCKVFSCKAGVQSEVFFADDIDDGDECTADACDSNGATHENQPGVVCHANGGTGTCDATGACAMECGFVDESGAEVGCDAAPNKCTLSYCDKSNGTCVLEELDGVAVPGTTPGDCGGTYCLAGEEDPQVAPMGTTCLDPDGNVGVCNTSGACVGCNTKEDCQDSTPESECHEWVCMGNVCANTTEPDGPLGSQMAGDCHLKTCSGGFFADQIDSTDVLVDGNDCTDDVCVAGVPMNPNLPLNTLCGGGGALYCDGGICKGCTQDAQCVGGTDCKVPKCDVAMGQCFFMPEPAGKVTSVQNPGDCTDNVCDANGNITTTLQPLDPQNDGNDCTTDVCTAMNATSHTPVGSGLTCNTGGGVVCDSSAHCVGKPCSVQGECQNGTFCVDGVCCETSCGGTCNACTGAKKGGGPNGLCGPVLVGDPDSDCAGNSSCSAGLCQALPLSAACVGAAGECMSGNCVDGFCCNSSCTGLCQSCSAAPGTCTPIGNGLDPAAECANGACDGTGACRKDNGQTCATGAECLNNSCVDGVCCNGLCGGTCQACNVAGSLGSCVSVPNNQDPASECANGACNGGGQCKLDNGQACFAGGECLSNNCIDGVCCNTACGATCQACTNAKTGGTTGTCSNVTLNTDPDTECVGVTTCNGAGACNKQANGATCTVAGECTSGNCVDGVCCNSACGSLCQACTNAKTGGTTGTCGNVTTNTDPDSECSGTQVCNGSSGAGSCKKILGDGCGVGTECLSAQCKDSVCCNNTCNGLCEACNLGGSIGTCSPIANGQDPASECPGGTSCNGALTCALFANGAACLASAECSSGTCIDGVCCNVACNGLCQACTNAKTGGTTGTCAPIPSNQDPDNECSGTQVCNGSSGAGSCKKPIGDMCVAGECLSGNCVDGVCCNTACSGTCVACNLASNVGTCTGLPTDTDPANECTGALVCGAAQTCVPGPNGTACPDGVDASCTSNHCIDGVCCSTGSCNGTCRSCDQAKTVGGAAGVCDDIKVGTDPDNECTDPQTCNASQVCQ